MTETADSLIGTAMRYMRTQERLRAALVDGHRLVEAVGGIADLDATLAPELTAALEHLEGVSGSLDRASRFLDARLEVYLTRLRDEQETG